MSYFRVFSYTYNVFGNKAYFIIILSWNRSGRINRRRDGNEFCIPKSSSRLQYTSLCINDTDYFGKYVLLVRMWSVSRL